MEFRGAAAIIVLGISGIVIVGFGGLTIWWLSRKPETAAAIQPVWTLFRWSFVLAMVAMIGLTILGLLWALGIVEP